MALFFALAARADVSRRERDHARAARRARRTLCNTVSKRPLGASRTTMKLLKEKIQQAGAAGYLLLWLLGIPVPVLLLFFLLRGCR